MRNIELSVKAQKKIVITVFYRTWSKQQKVDLENICEIMDRVGDEGKLFIGLGDANLDKLRFENENYPHSRLRDKLRDTLSRNDLKISNLGPTYKSRSNNCESELDYFYFSSILER